MNIEPLVQVLAGGFLAIIGGFVSQVWSLRQERRSVAHAFAGEIGALLGIIHERQYETHLRQVIEHVRSENKAYEFRVGAKQHYFQVYESNTCKIGLLEHGLAESVTKFYTFIKALLEDVADTAISRPDPKDSLQHLERLLKLLLKTQEIGKDAVDRLRKV